MCQAGRKEWDWNPSVKEVQNVEQRWTCQQLQQLFDGL